MQQYQALFESLFNRNFDAPGNKNLLEQVTAAHPYFSPAHFFLLQKTGPGTEAYEKQLSRTGIFFNNPYWLNYQLQQVNEQVTIEAEEQEVHIVELTENKTEDPEVFAVTEEQPAEIEEQAELVTEEITENKNEEPEVFPVAEDNPVEQQEQLTADTDADMEMEKEIEPMKIELKITEEKNTNGNDLLFEPMHLVDYFASQGIKLSEDAPAATDKLGKQLKSFTEWLKTMKKIHPGDSSQTEPARADETVEMLAEKSNIENEVLTEAMAEVFARQGKMVKATELYQKLSLLNPAKSAYFAAKIENLKRE